MNTDLHGWGMYGRLPTAPLYKVMSRVQGSGGSATARTWRLRRSCE